MSPIFPGPRPVIIVSGLPRSGTSMLMAMLQAGGVPLLVDENRPADPSNPRGYFEYEPVKRLRQDNAWMHEILGKAVKIISYLLPEIPENLPARILFMERPLPQILASQRHMLERQGKPENQSDDPALAHALEKHLAHIRPWLQARANTHTLFLTHKDVVTEPQNAAEAIATFLQEPCNKEAMTQAVKPELWHER